ncbi:unnamed protein product [Notodromas monacha]|uniref:nicotinamidase n=1 Tax=Notodromas monacha TaxID=399045 RepID=A0A7R9BMQ5_9CRUS|nr:unnamed protein product [Notodromas monacha]CAG0916980.1 unnamed protein product [Notodromas monacha]
MDVANSTAVDDYFDNLVRTCNREVGLLKEKECFETFNRGKVGFLNVIEFIVLCEALFHDSEGRKYNVEKQRMAEIFASFDTCRLDYSFGSNLAPCFIEGPREIPHTWVGEHCYNLLSKMDLTLVGFLNVIEFIVLCEALFHDSEGRKYNVEKQRMAEIFASFDTNKDGFIDLTEFQACWKEWIAVICWPKPALLVIDVQNDFINGSLSMDNCPAGHKGVEVIEPINGLLENVTFDAVVYSYDWHPENHISFLSNVKQRPMDASSTVKPEEAKVGDVVVFAGSQPTEVVLWPDHCVQNSWGAELHQNLTVVEGAELVYKGTNPEIDSFSAFWDNGKLSETELDSILKKRGITDVFCVGLAYDYCVDDATRSIDPDTVSSMTAELLALGVEIINSDKVNDMARGYDRHPTLAISSAKNFNA